MNWVKVCTATPLCEDPGQPLPQPVTQPNIVPIADIKGGYCRFALEKINPKVINQGRRAPE
jgi:hypothetical protein